MSISKRVNCILGVKSETCFARPGWTSLYSIEQDSHWRHCGAVTHDKCGEKKSSTYPFELQKNEACALNLSEDKNMVLSLFMGNIYCHIWNNKNKKHLSLNHDELMCVLSNKVAIEHITELLSEDTKQ